MVKKLSLMLVLVVLLSACNKGPAGKATPTPDARRQLINELSVSKRPFVVVFPHTTSKLLTLYLDNISGEYKSATLDLEYLAGNALKGGRTSLALPVGLPYAQAFLLGSCSSGGKCSFDTNLISGDIKTRLETGDQAAVNILKSQFIFVTKEPVVTIDGRVAYTPKDKSVNQILLDTQGLPKPVAGELAYSPIAVASVSNKKITADLSFKVSGVKSVLLYDGTNYVSLKADISADGVNIPVSLAPWSKTVQIIRDDLKGAGETLTVYLVGPILLVK